MNLKICLAKNKTKPLSFRNWGEGEGEKITHLFPHYAAFPDLGDETTKTSPCYET